MTRNLRRIIFVTGTRADFGKLLPLSDAAISGGFDVAYFVTGMHMLQRYGLTSREVQRETDSENYYFVNQSEGDSHSSILSKTLQGFGDWIQENPADLVVIHGDRVEALAVALYCAMNSVPVAHIEGGEVSGTIDEVYRHCNSKLSTTHFVSSESAMNRLRSLGERPDRIFVIGSPELDRHSSIKDLGIGDVRAHYEIDYLEYGIAIFHPVTSELERLESQSSIFFDALQQTGKNFIVIMPNNDPGSGIIQSHLDELPKTRFKVFPSMRFDSFSILLRNCSLIVGNSSVGVREAPFMGVPSIDVGTRQTNRSNATSIIQVSGEKLEEIVSQIERQWGKKFTPNTTFGAGKASKAFVDVLKDERYWSTPLQKYFYDL